MIDCLCSEARPRADQANRDEDVAPTGGESLSQNWQKPYQINCFFVYV